MTREPAVRARLHKALPRRIRVARGLLFTVASFAVLTLIVLGVLVIAGSFARFGFTAEGVALPVATMVGGAVGAIFAARGMRSRQQWGWILGVVASAYFVALPAYNLAALVSGTTGLDGNPAFFYSVYQILFILPGLVALYQLLRSTGWARSLASDTAASAPEVVIEPVPGRIEAGAHRGDGVSRDGDRPLVAVRGLKKHFPIYGGVLRRQLATLYAVDGVDFDVYPGEVFSVVGESGCGKTTLARALLQLTPPTAGKVYFDGYELDDVDPDDMRPLRRRMQIIFQDPFGSLNPRMPISDIIGEGLLAQGMTERRERDKKVEDSLEVVGLRRDYTRRYPHEFSGGQRQRIGIARALALGPDFVVCDEPVSALDVSIQSQILNLLLDLRRDFNLTYLFISHNLSVVQYISDRVGVMYLGKVVEIGTVEELYRRPRHPYTVALLSAIPVPDPRRRRRRLVLQGDVPSPAAPPSGCRFHPRCWLRQSLGNPEICAVSEPELRDLAGGHRSACHFAEDVSSDTVTHAVDEQSAAEKAVAESA